MSGYIARKGFRYQDLYLLMRVLEAVREVIDRSWTAGQTNVTLSLDQMSWRFGIEALSRLDASGILDWDVIVKSPGRTELAELKSGTVARDDRIAFWRRIRREGVDALERIHPVLVLDPDTAGTLEHFEGLAQVAHGTALAAPTNCEGKVTSPEKLLQEAMWTLCDPSDTSGGPALVPRLAQEILTRFSLHRLRAADLEVRVERLIETLWPASLAQTYEPLLVGWLGARASSNDIARRQFTARELFAEIGVLAHSLIFDAARLQRWQALWNELPAVVRQRTRGHLGQSGQAVPSQDIQPAASSAVGSGAPAILLTGVGGAGKSTFIAQAVDVACARGELVLWCGADDMETDEIEELIESFRFRAGLLHLGKPDEIAHLYLDGLDEASSAKRQRWAELLSRVATIKNVRVLASIRGPELRRDAHLSGKLATWTKLDLNEWPNEVVERLISSTPYMGKLPRSVLVLLCTPILLDLFWRTFVENTQPDAIRAAKLRSRYELLAAFWDQRLLNSPRHASRPDLPRSLSVIFAHAAQSVGSFIVSANLEPTAALLLSEGVLVEEGRLQRRLSFRHPLLRDFAFAQSCLSAASPTAAAKQWLAIEGGIQRFGALRAVAEALTARDAAVDYPSINLTTFLQALLTIKPAAGAQVAQLLGTLTDLRGLDPHLWPAALQEALPTGFANAIISAATLDENPAWAAVVEQWPVDLACADERYLYDLWRYAELLLKKSKSEPADLWAPALHSVARRLRTLTVDPRFAGALDASAGWLDMKVTNCVVQALPDATTLCWVEKRIPVGTWRVRSFLLEHLASLIAVDPERTAGVYRSAIGLIKEHGQAQLDGKRWGGLMPEQAIHWSLTGEGKSPALLERAPRAFFPVALDLAEALLHLKQADRDDSKADFEELMEAIAPGSTADDSSRADLGDLIDDAPQWSYWSSIPAGEHRHRLLEAIHDHAKALVTSAPDLFYENIAPLLRGSRLVSIQSIVLDILLEHRADPRSLALLSNAAFDQRLYHASDVDYWLEQTAATAWPSFTVRERDKLQDTILALLTKQTWGSYRARKLIRALPPTELRSDLTTQINLDPEDEIRPSRRPHRGEDDDEDFGLVPDSPAERAQAKDTVQGIWPETADRAVLLQLERSAEELSKTDIAPDSLIAELSKAVASATAILTALKSDQPTLVHDDNAWIWDAFKKTLEAHRHERPDRCDPPDQLVRDCTELALAVFRQVPAHMGGKLPDGELWMDVPQSAWTRALDLLDESLVWEPANNASQEEFIGIIERCFATGNPKLQILCAHRIRAYHWLRVPARRQLFRRLVWETPTEPRVLRWALGTAARANDEERTEIYRIALQRGNLFNAKDLVDGLGNYIGRCGIAVFSNGHRSSVANLAREIITDPARFPLLQDDANACEYWRSFAFGLKEQVKGAPERSSSASDYGQWMLAAWRELRRRKTKKNRSYFIVLFATYWMQRKGNTDAQLLQPWWDSLDPLLSAVIAEGSAVDNFNIFFNLHDGQLNHITTAEQVLRYIKAFVARIDALSPQIDLDARDDAADEQHSWRETSDYAAQVIDALRKDGLLGTDYLRERAHQLLSQLSAAPFRSADAAAFLHHLQGD